ncbi:Rv1535 domain-containing protein [Mycolicibacterium sp. ND9-15]|nr:Rv1535 domain-containing protein [Mycolicibacterium sp. ND9-15]WSE55338.1 Rv1535 domain-containing protein [Mycolicibacterium sp. ND9-15]
MTDVSRSVGPEALLDAGVRLLTPPLREIYALLVRVGVLTIDD